MVDSTGKSRYYGETGGIGGEGDFWGSSIMNGSQNKTYSIEYSNLKKKSKQVIYAMYIYTYI